MNRAAFESRVQELLDERRSPSLDAELVRAADEHPELKPLLAAYELLAFRPSSAPLVPADLTERVLNEWKLAAFSRRPSRPSWFAPLAAVAATLVLATSIAFLAQARRGEDSAVASNENSPAITQTPDAAAPRLDRLSRQAAENYRSLAVNTEASLTSAMSIVQTNRGHAEPSVTAAREPSAWLESVPSNLRPLSSSASGAIYSLLRAVPGAESEEREGL